MKIRYSRLSENGFATLEVLMASVLAVIVAGSVAAMLNNMNKSISRSNTIIALQQLRALIEQSISSPGAWKFTLGDSNNVHMNCYGNDCRPYQGQTMAVNHLYENSNELLVNTAATNVGFDKNGKKCYKFDEQNGSDECPFQFRLAWQPVNCPPTPDSKGNYVPCPNPDADVYGMLIIKFKNNALIGPINAANYAFKVSRGPATSAVGDPDKGSGDISKLFGKQCPSDSQMRGFNSDGSFKCEKQLCKTTTTTFSGEVGSAYCPSGQTYMGGGGTCSEGALMADSSPSLNPNGTSYGWSIHCSAALEEIGTGVAEYNATGTRHCTMKSFPDRIIAAFTGQPPAICTTTAPPPPPPPDKVPLVGGTVSVLCCDWVPAGNIVK